MRLVEIEKHTNLVAMIDLALQTACGDSSNAADNDARPTDYPLL